MATQTFVRITLPKMRRLAARREHVRIDDADLIRGVLKFTEGLKPQELLFLGSQLDFTAAFRKLVVKLGVPYGQGTGLTPASLRAGGATFWYHRTDSTEFVRFRGRWSNMRMLEIYIQEVAASSLLTGLDSDTQSRVASFALAAPWLMAHYG